MAMDAGLLAFEMQDKADLLGTTTYHIILLVLLSSGLRRPSVNVPVASFNFTMPSVLRADWGKMHTFYNSIRIRKTSQEEVSQI